MWKFKNFSFTQILRKINFGAFNVFREIIQLISRKILTIRICILHCGNFKHFLPLRFYVKSILDISKGLRMVNLEVFEALNIVFFFGKFQLSKSAKNHKNQNSEAQKMSNIYFCNSHNN